MSRNDVAVGTSMITNCKVAGCERVKEAKAEQKSDQESKRGIIYYEVAEVASAQEMYAGQLQREVEVRAFPFTEVLPPVSAPSPASSCKVQMSIGVTHYAIS